jgi:hypothetical protein
MSALGVHTTTMALGLGRKGRDDYILVVRLQQRALEGSPQLEAIQKQAKNDLEVRYIGPVVKLAARPWQQNRNRPLRLGGSVGHFKITAGTLGCVVREVGAAPVMILSNNHVLANENRGKMGRDPIVQPGPIDAGQNPKDKVATLSHFGRLKKTKPNLVDCAMAALDDGIKFNAGKLEGLGKLAAVGDAAFTEHEWVGKVGRTTGTTRGRITAFELDNVMVRYDTGVLRFDQQIEIESDGSRPFSEGGDSGSLIVDQKLRGIGPLFAMGDQGGSDGLGLTYANPLLAVLEALKVKLVVK